MKPELRPISVTIVDLMGAFLPGTIWLILFLTVRKLFWVWLAMQTVAGDITPISVTLGLAENRTITFYIVLLVFSFIIGYSMKLLVMSIAERFSAIFPYLWYLFKKKKEEKKEFKDFLFPYYKEYKAKKYFKQIEDIIKEKFNWENDSLEDEFISLPTQNTQPFSVSKRILRVLNPSLWEESELREATVRMLASILLSAIFSLICAIFSIIINSRITSIAWIITSLIVVIFLSFAFRKARKAEVSYTYLNFLIASKFKSGSENAPK